MALLALFLIAISILLPSDVKVEENLQGLAFIDRVWRGHCTLVRFYKIDVTMIMMKMIVMMMMMMMTSMKMMIVTPLIWE